MYERAAPVRKKQRSSEVTMHARPQRNFSSCKTWDYMIVVAVGLGRYDSRCIYGVKTACRHRCRKWGHPCNPSARAVNLFPVSIPQRIERATAPIEYHPRPPLSLTHAHYCTDTRSRTCGSTKMVSRGGCSVTASAALLIWRSMHVRLDLSAIMYLYSSGHQPFLLCSY